MNDKVCVITGGTSGIGKCIVDTFIDSGYRIAIIDKNNTACRDMSVSYPDDKLFIYCGDIAQKKDLEKFRQLLIDRFDHVDSLVNNACLSKKGILSGCSYDDFNYVLQVGVSAPYYLTSLLLPHFAPGGSIVNISSIRANMSQPDTESYSAAKGGISALTHALCISLAGKVRVNSISPGWINTGSNDGITGADNMQHPSGRVGRPEDIARMALYLCCRDAEFINGENITIDGGMSRQMIYHNDHSWRLEI